MTPEGAATDERVEPRAVTQGDCFQHGCAKKSINTREHLCEEPLVASQRPRMELDGADKSSSTSAGTPTSPGGNTTDAPISASRQLFGRPGTSPMKPPPQLGVPKYKNISDFIAKSRQPVAKTRQPSRKSLSNSTSSTLERRADGNSTQTANGSSSAVQSSRTPEVVVAHREKRRRLDEPSGSTSQESDFGSAAEELGRPMRPRDKGERPVRIQEGTFYGASLPSTSESSRRSKTQCPKPDGYGPSLEAMDMARARRLRAHAANSLTTTPPSLKRLTPSAWMAMVPPRPQRDAFGGRSNGTGHFGQPKGANGSSESPASQNRALQNMFVPFVPLSRTKSALNRTEPATILGRRRASGSTLDPAIVDNWIYSQPGVQPPPPGVALELEMYRARRLAKPVVFAEYLRPRADKNRPLSDEQYNKVIEERKARGGRKVNFGKGAQGLRRQRELDGRNGNDEQGQRPSQESLMGQARRKFEWNNALIRIERQRRWGQE